jgi:hypothetical protein
MRKKEHGKKLRWSFEKTKIDEETRLLDDPHNSRNVKGRRKKTVSMTHSTSLHKHQSKVQ